MWFYYDESGVSGFKYGGVNYIYEKNILGDIIAIWNANGTKVGDYLYDSWGNIQNISAVNNNSVLSANPFRYRGYYFDNESHFYYLNSRYYDPQLGRFINADDPSILLQTASIHGGANLYAYCLNNPITYTDPSGEFPLLLLALIGVGIGFGGAWAYDTASSAGYEGWELAGMTAMGGVTGGVIGYLAWAALPAMQAFASSSWTINLPWITGIYGGAATGAAITITGMQIIGAGAAVGIGVIAFSKRDPSTNKPSWVDRNDYSPNQTPQQNAKRLLDNKYGHGNWKNGPGSEFSKIVKWIQRHVLKLY